MNSTRKFLFSLLLFVMLGCLAGCGGSSVKTYTASGYVFSNGEKLGNVSVSYEGGTVQSDENGYFEITNLTEATVLWAEKEDYVFYPSHLSVSSFLSLCRFEAYAYFDIAGRVESNGTPIAGAKVTADGLRGGSVFTDRHGVFYLSEVAGKLSVSVSAEGYTFLDKTISGGGEDVVFDGIYGASGTVRSESGPLEGVKVSDGFVETLTAADGSWALDGVRAYSELTATLDGYSFLPAKHIVDREQSTAEFVGYPVYALIGTVRSGIRPIANAKITAEFSRSDSSSGEASPAVKDAVIFETYSRSDGSFLFEVFGTVEVSCESEGLTFERFDESQIAELDFNGSFPLRVRLTSRGQPLADAKVRAAGAEAVTDSDGTAGLSVHIGDELTAECEGYHIDGKTVSAEFADRKIAAADDTLEFEAWPLYDLSVGIAFEGTLPAVGMILGGRELTVENGRYSETGLWGDLNLSLKSEGFAFRIGEGAFGEDSLVNEQNCNLSVFADKYYTVSGSAASGGMRVSDFSVSAFDGERFEKSVVGSDGNFSIGPLLGARRLVFSAQGYETAELPVDFRIESPIGFSVTYVLSGRVVTGSLPVAGATVTCGEQTAVSDADGGFRFSGLAGEVEISAESEGYVFDGSYRGSDPYGTPILDSTYSIFGAVYNQAERKDSDGNTVLDGNGNPVYDREYLPNIHVFGQPGEEILKGFVTGEDGAFGFSGVRGKITLHAYSTGDEKINFKPNALTVTGFGTADRYYFEANAYQLGGTVTSGGLPVSGVRFKTREKEVYSKADGTFTFEVLKSKVTIVPEKEGYVFSPASFTPDRLSDKDDIVFTCTYTVAGTVRNGGAALAGVTVTLGESSVMTDETGTYRFDGVSGRNELKLEREGYVFFGETCVEDYDPERDFESVYEISGRVTTGEIGVGGVRVFRGANETLTLADGTFTLSGLSGGGAVSFEKTGYVFANSDPIDGYRTGVAAEGTYTVRGTVTSGGIPVAQAKVTAAGVVKMTGADGSFSISGLTGENIIEIAKLGYRFESLTVSEYDPEIEISGTYGYRIVVSVGSKAVEGVKVTGFGREALTDANGTAVFEGLSGSGTFDFEKSGYTIESIVVEGYGESAVSAKFSLSGTIETGGIPVSDVVVTCGALSVTTDRKGTFSFEGLSGSVTLGFRREGYEFTNPGIFKEYRSGIVVDATYEVFGTVYADDGRYEGVTITAMFGEEIKTKVPDSQGIYRFTGLSGETVLTFEREGNFRFNFDTLTVAEYADLGENNCGKIYNLTGTVTVNGSGIAGVTVRAGKLEAVTGADGTFSFGTVVGQTTVYASIDTVDLDGKAYSCKSASRTVNGESKLNFTLDVKSYALAMVYRGYEILGTSNFSSKTSGRVDAGAGGIQSVRGFKQRDSLGNYINQNINKGNKVFGVDPCVAHLLWLGANGEISYKEPRGTGNVFDDSVNYDAASWNDVTSADYKSRYGSSPYRMTPYIVTSATVNSVSVSFESGKTVVRVVYNPSTATANYKKQMETLSGQSIKEYTKNELTYSFDSEGKFQSINFIENYTVQLMSVKCTTELNEIFAYGGVADLTRDSYAK